MRVRVEQPTTAYWNYVIQRWDVGEELDGEVARHLADNAPAGSIKVIEDDREVARRLEAEAAAKAAGSNQPDPTGPGDSTGAEDGDDSDSVGGPPVDGTIDDLMAWIGDDRDKAAQALTAEQAKDKPRSTVVKRLTALTEAE